MPNLTSKITKASSHCQSNEDVGPILLGQVSRVVQPELDEQQIISEDKLRNSSLNVQPQHSDVKFEEEDDNDSFLPRNMFGEELSEDMKVLRALMKKLTRQNAIESSSIHEISNRPTTRKRTLLTDKDEGISKSAGKTPQREKKLRKSRANQKE